MKFKVAMIALSVSALACGGDDGDQTAVADGVQIVQVGVEQNAYTFTPASVEAGVPVRLVFDPGNLPGCSKAVTLPAYEITKTIVEGDATIEFTPRDEGPVSVACTMNMYTGTLAVD